MRGLGKDIGRWRKSSHSGREANCVEAVLRQDAEIGVRDSTRPDGTALGFGAGQWTALLWLVRSG